MVFAYICLIFMVNVGKDTIHGSYGFVHWSTIILLMLFGSAGSSF